MDINDLFSILLGISVLYYISNLNKNNKNNKNQESFATREVITGGRLGRGGHFY